MRRPTIPLAAAAAIAMTSLVASPASCAEVAALTKPDFRVPDQHRAGVVPSASVIADFTGDGKNDVATAAFGGVGLFVFPGKGDGELRKAIENPLPGGASAYGLASADFDDDGLVDLAVYTVGGDDDLQIMISNGDGTFTRSDSLESGGTGLVAAGDVDGDGAMDVVLTQGSSDGDLIKVYLNDGSGQFGPADTYTPPFFIGIDTLDLVDVDDDGDLDLLYLSGCPSVRLNDGNGNFDDEICSSDSQGRIGGITLAWADLDGNGTVDIATGNASGERVSIAKGDGAGRFTFFRMYEDVNPQLNSLVTADLDGDGKLDLLAGSNLGTSALLTGNGDATFDPQVDWIVGGSDLVLGQLGGSALPEIVSAGGLALNEISVTLNVGNGRFDAPRMFDAGGNATQLELGDLDEDGQDDVALVIDRSSIVVHRTVGGRPTFGPPVESPIVADQTLQLRLADLDEDGLLDAVGTLDSAPNLFVALGNGDRSFGAPTRYSNGSSLVGGLEVADVTGDGHLDVITSTGTQQSVAPGNGNGRLASAIKSGEAPGTTQSTLIDDLDGDGDLDIVAGIRTGSLRRPGLRLVINHNDGAGRFTAAYERGTNSNLSGAAIGDLDQDGLPEVVVTGTRGQPRPGRRGLFVWANNSGKLVQSPKLVDPNAPNIDVLLADVNLDGRLDAVTRGGPNLGIYLTKADGSFAKIKRVPLAADQLFFEDGDLTGDGKVDLVVAYGSLQPSTFAPYVNTTR